MEYGKDNRRVESFWRCIAILLAPVYAESDQREVGSHPSVLDMVFTLTALEVENIVYELPLGKSDHLVVRLDSDAEEIVARVGSSREIKRK